MVAYKLTPDAKKELRSIIKWYNKQRKDLGKLFYNQVKTTYRYIQKHLEGFEHKYNGFRGSPVSGFPFIVFYDVLPEYIAIVSIFHTSKDLSRLDDRVID